MFALDNVDFIAPRSASLEGRSELEIESLDE